MTTPNIVLWNRIDALAIGPQEASLSFSRRLARENGWSMEYADAVIAEYKKFIYLVASGGEELTPSDPVDQAWHLHMTYTRPYWHDLCRDVLEKELHHLPTKGGGREQARFRAQYERTLRIYEGEFGHPPPVSIWPSVAERFDGVEHFVRVNRAACWVIKKPSPMLAKGLAVVTVPLYLVACGDDPGGYDTWFWLKAAFGVLVLYKVFRWLDPGGRGGGSGGGGSGCGGCTGCGGD